MSQLLEDLKEVRRLIAEVGWTQGASAKLACGVRVSPCAKEAACFCLDGAVSRATNYGFFRKSENRLRYTAAATALLCALLPPDLGRTSYVEWNDRPGRTKEDVLALIDRAIEAIKR